MNILTKLTKKNLKLNKKRTVGTIIGILLSVALICAVSGMFTSFRETLVKYAIKEGGYFHIALKNITQKDLKKYEVNKDIKEINKLYELGQSTYGNLDEDTTYITVYSINKDDFNKLAYTLVEGNFPTNSKEILISKKMALNSNLKVGDYLELNIGTRKTIDGYELNENNPYNADLEYLANSVLKKYKIVGITYRERNSYNTYGITTGEINDNIHAYISLKKPRDYQKSFMEILGVNNYKKIASHQIEDLNFDYSINDELLRWEVFKFSDSTISAITTIIIVVISIIIVVSVFCIRNSFAISTTEKMKMYGMLASVGATKKQIKKSVIYEGLLLGLIGIPLGIICGIIAVLILIQVVNLLLGEILFTGMDMGGLVFKVSFPAIAISALLGIVTIYFSSISSAKKASRVSPIDNLRNSKNVKISAKKLKTPKFIKQLFKTGGVLAYKNLKRSKKKYRTTVVSLTVSIFVFIAMFYFINEGFEESKMYYNDYNYNIRIYGGLSDYTDSQINTLRNLNNVDNSYLVYEDTGPSKVLDTNKIKTYDDCNLYTTDIYTSIIAIDKDSFKKYVKELNLNYDEVKDKGILIDEFRYFSTVTHKLKMSERYKYKKGDFINLEYDRVNSKEKLSIKLADVTRKKPIGLESFYNNNGYIVLNKDYYNHLDIIPSAIMINTDKPDDVSKEIELLDKNLIMMNFDEQAKAERSMIIVISIFLYGFITVITLIGVTNIFNTLTSNMELRQKEFAMLKSIGMTKKEFNRMINLETLFYSSKSLIYGIVLGITASYLIHLGFDKNIERAYKLPVLGIVISIIFVFIIVSIIMKYSMKKINKQNTIETIRKENV